MASCAFAHLCVLVWRWEVFLSHYTFLRHCLSLNLEHTDLTRLAGQWAQYSSCSWLPVLWFQELPAMFNTVHRCWGSELRFRASSTLPTETFSPKFSIFKKQWLINVYWIFLSSFLPFSFVVLGFEYKTLYTLGKYSVLRYIPRHLLSFYFGMTISLSCSGLWFIFTLPNLFSHWYFYVFVLLACWFLSICEIF